jgi:hypothetical protein
MFVNDGLADSDHRPLKAMSRTFAKTSMKDWMGLGGVMMHGLPAAMLPAAILLAGPSVPPMPPIEIEKPVAEEQPGIKVENFRFEIDQKNFDCSAGTLNSGNKAPYAYNPSTNAFAGELQIHAAQCKTRF